VTAGEPLEFYVQTGRAHVFMDDGLHLPACPRCGHQDLPDPVALRDGFACTVPAKTDAELAEEARRNELEALKYATSAVPTRPDGGFALFVRPHGDSPPAMPAGGESAPPVFVDVERLRGHLEQLAGEIQDHLTTLVQAKIQEVLQKLRVGS
jgi:hypothetical protein